MDRSRREGGNTMTRDEFLKAFAAMSPGDQEAIRAEITGKGKRQEAGATCCPTELMGKVMEKMKAGGNPMSMCKEMMKKMAGECC